MATGRPAKTTHADRLLIRELYRFDREPRLTLHQIAARFPGLSHMAVWRVLQLDSTDIELRRRDEVSRGARAS